MKSWVLAVGLLAAAASGPVKAADLDEGPPDRYGSAYDDPRYADIYRYPDERRPVPRAPVYGDRYDDDRDDYREPRRYSYKDPRPHRGPACRASRSSIACRIAAGTISATRRSAARPQPSSPAVRADVRSS